MLQLANRKRETLKGEFGQTELSVKGARAWIPALLPFSSLNSVLNINGDSLSSKTSLQGLVSHVILFSFPTIKITVVLKA